MLGWSLAAEWPEFRGPGGQGHAEGQAPLHWSGTENVRWKRPVPGRGWSSPAIAGNRVWLTTADDDGRSLRALCFESETGDLLHDVEVFRVRAPIGIHAKNSFASPTPVIDAERVYIHFGAEGAAGLSRDGAILWKTRLDYRPMHGSGGSPVLYRDLLVIACDGTDRQFVTALDTATGKVRWKAPRNGAHAYATPLIIRTGERDQVVSPGGFFAASYDPANGKELWRVRYGDGFSNVPRPVFAHGLVFLCTGFFQPSVLAVRPGEGDVTDSNIVWRLDRGAPLTPSPIIVGDEIYVVSDNGIVTCAEARTGKILWRERFGGNFSASPVFAAGRLYFLNEEGETTVIAPGRDFRRLAVNRIAETTLASLAVSEGSLYLRSESNLFRIEDEGK